MAAKNEHPTNRWDAVMHLIDVVGDKNRIGSLLIVFTLVGFFHFLLKGMDSQDKKALVFGVIDRLGALPWILCFVELVILVLFLWVCRRVYREFTNHIDYLSKFKRFFFHGKEDLFKAIEAKGNMSRAEFDGILAKIAETYKITNEDVEFRLFRGITHRSSGFSHKE